VNEGGDLHDLAVPDGTRTRKLDPGQSQRLDLGKLSGSLPELYCALPGHKSAGMTLDIRVQGSAES
jgi:nitrite reductase (NO-forming)